MHFFILFKAEIITTHQTNTDILILSVKAEVLLTALGPIFFFLVGKM